MGIVGRTGEKEGNGVVEGGEKSGLGTRRSRNVLRSGMSGELDGREIEEGDKKR